MMQHIYDAFFAQPTPLPQIQPSRKTGGGACRVLVALVALRMVSGALNRMLPFALVLGLMCGAASADTPGGFMKPTPWQYRDVMAPYRAFPTARRVLAMLRFAAPIYGLDVQQVTSVRPGPNEGSDKTGVASYRYRHFKCEGSAQVHVIGGNEIEGGWRLRDVAELQHVGERCGK